MIPWWSTPHLKPMPSEGVYFRRRAFDTFATIPHPSKTRAYGASWFGMDDDKSTQPCCHVVGEIDSERRLHITECHHAWITLEEAVSWQFQIHDGIHRTTVEATSFPKKANIYGVRTWFCTPDQYHGGLDDLVSVHRRRLKAENRPQSLPLNKLPIPFDLHGSARRLQSEIIGKRILLPQSDPWVASFLSEMCQWPTVRTDARVKAMCVLVSALPNISPPGRSESVDGGRGSPWAA